MAKNGCNLKPSNKRTSQGTPLAEDVWQLILQKQLLQLHLILVTRLGFQPVLAKIQPIRGSKGLPFDSSCCTRKCARSMGVRIMRGSFATAARTPYHTCAPRHSTPLHTREGQIVHPYLILTADTTVILLPAAVVTDGIFRRLYTTQIHMFCPSVLLNRAIAAHSFTIVAKTYSNSLVVPLCTEDTCGRTAYSIVVSIVALDAILAECMS